MDKKQFRQNNLKDMLSWSLDKKINHSLKRIREFHKSQEGKVCVSFSGGKDSTVLLHLVRSIYPNTPAVFSDTTNEFIEIKDFIKTVDNVTTVKPKMTFNETIETYGFPLVSKKTAKAVNVIIDNRPTAQNMRNLYLNGVTKDGRLAPRWKLAKKWHPLLKADFKITNKCCDVLKKEPIHRFHKETGLSSFIGTMAEESNYRQDAWIKNGCNIYEGKEPMSKPLSIWTEKNIWEYIERFNVPCSDIYNDIVDKKTGEVLIEGEKRTGCAYCAFGAHLEKSDLLINNRFERLKLRKPKQYKKIMALKNNGVTFSEALDFIKVNH